MAYLEFKTVEAQQLVCNHPKVYKAWAWGGGTISTNIHSHEFTNHIAIMLHDGTRKDFKSDGFDPLPLDEAEEYLNTLN